MANRPKTILYFKNTEMHSGVNYTVRLGSKWFEMTKVGDRISVAETGETNLHGLPMVEIVSLMYCRYHEIPPFVLEHEHDSKCINFKGLDEAMERAYPGFTKDKHYMNSYVTCVGFINEI